jgi:hypothetical protein
MGPWRMVLKGSFSMGDCLFVIGLLAWTSTVSMKFVGLACKGKDIVFRFFIKYSSLRDFGP